VRDVVIPKMGMSSVEVDIIEWHVAVGDAVERGTPLVDVESEKAILTIEAEEPGVVAEILLDEGSEAAVGDVICRLEVRK
jgi:pyruvate/2-oxoglutarate dehydrogenase complex dihydrolipoamide acyltransferase (E2) component